MNGTVKSIFSDKNFGFIKADNGEEHFFHREDVNGFWEEFLIGSKVSFEPVKNPKGPRASNVELIDNFNPEFNK